MLSLILACYVFCLSVGPMLAKAGWALAEEACATVCCLEEHDEDTPLASAQGDPNDCCDDGICNPFAGCTGCAGFTLPEIPDLATSVSTFLLQPLSYQRVVPRLATPAVWHPPQIV